MHTRMDKELNIYTLNTTHYTGILHNKYPTNYKKEPTIDTCNNIDESHRHHIKPQTQNKKLYLQEVQEQAKLINGGRSQNSHSLQEIRKNAGTD